MTACGRKAIAEDEHAQQAAADAGVRGLLGAQRDVVQGLLGECRHVIPGIAAQRGLEGPRPENRPAIGSLGGSLEEPLDPRREQGTHGRVHLA